LAHPVHFFAVGGRQYDDGGMEKEAIVRGLIVMLMAALVAGCGPMMAPMSFKLDEEQQKRYDEFWEQAAKPADRLSRQELLDAVGVTSAFQLGVDRLTFRSEKWFSKGVVIMVVQCDRFTPQNDRFDISIVDHRGKIVRYERYTREDVERTWKELWGTPSGGYKTATTQEVRAAEDLRRARYKRLHELFPDLVKDADEGKGH
jgi:hypothetical protein